MTELWYENPKILLDYPDQFLPSKNQSHIEKINALVRLAIYWAIIVYLLKYDNKLLSISVVIIIISFFLGQTETFVSTDRKLNKYACYKPTKDNPFMNYTIGDLIDNPSRLAGCEYEKAKSLIRQAFRMHLFSDSSDIWGKFISDRNFYTMPNTNIVNKQTEFANWCYGGSGECKSTGNNCLKYRDPVYHRGRITNTDIDEE
jgi:hypothetical protein